MPPEGHESITVSSKLRKRIGILKKERERELGTRDLSLDQFVEMMVTHWERTHRDTAAGH
jgi:hypothetical protein